MTIILRPHQKKACDAMLSNTKGQVIIPTGGGKTMCMIQDAIDRHKSMGSTTTVVVAPRILLAQQLCKEFMDILSGTWNHVMHVHSGETHYFRTTKSKEIALFNNTARSAKESCIIFTTYHSLHRIQEANIDVDTIYFDEAHNSIKRNFFPATEHFASDASRCYFFTATPKHSVSVFKPGMNDTEVYGKVICNVPATKLVEEGYILPPKVSIKELPTGDAKLSDCQNLLHTIDDNSLNKILIAARSTRQIVKLLAESDFYMQIQNRGYSCMYITSKTGAYIDGQKVDRKEFFDTLNAWGKDPEKKFIILHHSILSEGINVNGLEGVLFMRNMDYVGISQSIGRVIRLGGAEKTYGLICVPVYDKVGISTAKSVESVVDTVFVQGEAAVSVIRR
jgi:predicted helicase